MCINTLISLQVMRAVPFTGNGNSLLLSELQNLVKSINMGNPLFLQLFVMYCSDYENIL